MIAAPSAAASPSLTAPVLLVGAPECPSPPREAVDKALSSKRLIVRAAIAPCRVSSKCEPDSDSLPTQIPAPQCSELPST